MDRRLNVLLIEDSPGEVLLVREAFAHQRIEANLFLCEDGASAMRFLHANGPFLGAPRPNLIILDLGLPQLDGRAVLSMIKAHPVWSQIPLAVLTASAETQDEELCRRLGAEMYFAKPASREGYAAIIRALLDTAFARRQRGVSA